MISNFVEFLIYVSDLRHSGKYGMECWILFSYRCVQKEANFLKKNKPVGFTYNFGKIFPIFEIILRDSMQFSKFFFFFSEICHHSE